MFKVCSEIYSLKECFDYLKSLEILSIESFDPERLSESITKSLQLNNFSFIQNLLSSKIIIPQTDLKISRFFTDYPVYSFYYPGVVIAKNKVDNSFYAIKCFPSNKKKEESQRKFIESLSKLQHRYIARFFSY
jgi:hypothetical protein